jgi:hypothetical protein
MAVPACSAADTVATSNTLIGCGLVIGMFFPSLAGLLFNIGALVRRRFPKLSANAVLIPKNKWPRDLFHL